MATLPITGPARELYSLLEWPISKGDEAFRQEVASLLQVKRSKIMLIAMEFTRLVQEYVVCCAISH